MNTPETERFTETLRDKIREVGEQFTEPDDDWLSVFFMDDGKTLTISPLMPEMFASDASKNMLVAMLRTIIEGVGPERFALLLNSWGIKGEKAEGETPDESRLRAEAIASEWSGNFDLHPDRVEMLLLMVVDASETTAWSATIERHSDRPPTLGEWTSTGDFEGRFAELGSLLKEASDAE